MAKASWGGRAPRPPDSGDPFVVAAGGALNIKLAMNVRLGGTSVIPFFVVRRAWASRPVQELDRPEINCLSLCLTCSASTTSQDRVTPVHLSVLVAASAHEEVVYSLQFPIQHTLIKVPRVLPTSKVDASPSYLCRGSMGSRSLHVALGNAALWPVSPACTTCVATAFLPPAARSTSLSTGTRWGGYILSTSRQRPRSMRAYTVGILGQYCSSIGVACAHALSSASEHARSRAPRRRSCARRHVQLLLPLPPACKAAARVDRSCLRQRRKGLPGPLCRRHLSSSAGSAEVGVLRTFAVAPAAHCKTSTAPVSSRLW
ncbi:hypothetical protein AURDEDRAFT_117857 [Auricularia subglabra TFB-10046 SS5]|uniref:Uncharacterized protein n=1 Tax=Auricularia subglabra (strain TFB-10046 / SS5) TaxID=717982 RepID=J0WNU7_AURST|nr:hypothetical protein AURDEDRAFT_117857 [Auricularia subglabra TFB-10046 SS5]